MSGAAPVHEAIAAVYRREWGSVLAATVRLTRDLDLAEECTQDAFARALQTWPTSGLPARPGAWLTTVARNRAIDVLRRASLEHAALPQLAVEEVLAAPADRAERSGVDDDLLRLVFTCCHPALSHEAQVALTLRLVCGLTTSDVARALLVQDSTMAARITRAKRKIRAARIPYRVPPLEELPARLGTVLEVVHLVFTTGHSAPSGDRLLRQDLADRAIDLARALHALLPAEGEVAGLLALMLLVDARRDARLSDDGRLVLLAEQDRHRWHRDRIQQGIELLSTALQRAGPTRYTVQAAIAAVHAEAVTWDATDWDEIVRLYSILRRLQPSPVVDLNRAVAIGFRDGPEAGLEALEPLLAEPALASYGYLPAARADFLRRLERWSEAAGAYTEAIALTRNDVERDFLVRRLVEVSTRADRADDF